MRAAIIFATGLTVGCASFVARPLPPRADAVGSDSVRIDHMKQDRLALATRGPHRVTAVGLQPQSAAPASAACVPQTGAAVQIGPESHGVTAAPGETLVEARFGHDVFIRALAEPSTVTVQLEGAPPPCLRLTMSSRAPDYRWAFPPYDSHLEVGRGWHGYAAVADGHRWGGGLDWELLHVGRWLGRARPTLGLHAVAGSDQLAVRLGGLVLVYPLLLRHFGLGLGAGYDVAPAWSRRFQDGDRFKWTHGPRAEVHLTYVGQQLLGFPPAYQTSSGGLVLSVARADADRYRAIMFGLGMELL